VVLVFGGRRVWWASQRGSDFALKLRPFSSSSHLQTGSPPPNRD